MATDSGAQSAGRRLGVYVCRGCTIGDNLDVERLLDAVRAEATDDVEELASGEAFCLEDAERIAEAVRAGRIDGVVVAACSPRVNRAVLRWQDAAGRDIPVQRVNLREQVAWSQPAQAPGTQELAEDLLRMGIAAARQVRPPTPHRDHGEATVLVVGGGPAGLAAAVSAADLGHPVVLVEAEEKLGGFARHLHRQYPTRWPYRDLEPIGLEEWVAEVEHHPLVTVATRTHVRSLAGEPGAFTAELASDEATSQLTVGAVVLATGFRLAGTEQLGRFGLGSIPNVIDSGTAEHLAQAGGIVRPTDGQTPSRVAILACDGSDEGTELAYSGNVTSQVALKQAQYLRAANPDGTVYLVYEDMQTPGAAERFYRTVQEDPGVFLVRGQVEDMDETERGGVRVTVKDSALARRLQLDADLVILSAGMLPRSGPPEPPPLGLQYLQGPNLPLHHQGFMDSNFLCFPYETRRTGIYTAGVAHRAQDLAASRRDGAAAALKAVQVIAQSRQGAAVHPRVGDLGYPEFFLSQCTACGRCTQECPFGALELDAARHPVINPNRCRRCGICMGACPVQIISFPDYSVPMLSDMMKSISLPEDDPEALRILVLACENDAYPALDMAGFQHLELPVSLRVIPVRCLGSVNSVVVTDAIARGVDGVALLGCREGDAYQCHFIQGSQLLGQRISNIRETLGRLALEPERVINLETTIADGPRLPGVLGRFVETVNALGPNPMKGF